MRKQKKVIVTFLHNTSLETICKDITRLIENFDTELPQFKDLDIVLITNFEISHCKKISHPRLKAVVCGTYFFPKKGMQYILIKNGSPKEFNQVNLEMERKNQKPVEMFEIKGGKIFKIAA